MVNRNQDRWTEEERRRLAELLIGGASWAECGRVLGKCKDTCRMAAKRFGLGLVSAHNRSFPWTEAENLQLVELRKKGLTFRQIADFIGHTPKGCSERYAKIAGRPLRPQHYHKKPQPAVIDKVRVCIGALCVEKPRNERKRVTGGRYLCERCNYHCQHVYEGRV